MSCIMWWMMRTARPRMEGNMMYFLETIDLDKKGRLYNKEYVMNVVDETG